jgi:hypothetical protein
VQTYSRMAICAKGFLATQQRTGMMFFHRAVHNCT